MPYSKAQIQDIFGKHARLLANEANDFGKQVDKDEILQSANMQIDYLSQEFGLKCRAFYSEGHKKNEAFCAPANNIRQITTYGIKGIKGTKSKAKKQIFLTAMERRLGAIERGSCRTIYAGPGGSPEGTPINACNTPRGFRFVSKGKA